MSEAGSIEEVMFVIGTHLTDKPLKGAVQELKEKGYGEIVSPLIKGFAHGRAKKFSLEQEAKIKKILEETPAGELDEN